MERSVKSPARLREEITPPADKSISHRSLLLNSIAAGQAHISNFLAAEDCLSTLSCLSALGVPIRREGTEVEITGRGNHGFTVPPHVLDAGNSGTTLRLMTGLLAAQPLKVTITGDVSLRARPMGRVIEPLKLMGAHIRGQVNDTRAPLTITGAALKGITYRLPVASAQVKSAILLAGLFASSETIIEQPALSRDHTERMLRAMGADLTVEGLKITLKPLKVPLNPLSITVPGDISSAAFWLVAGAIHPDAVVRLLGVGLNPTRDGIIEVLQSMGAGIIIENQRFGGDEPVADIVIRSGALRGVEIGGAMIPRIIDEIPVIAVAAAVAEGVTVIRDAAELRVKESDRIETTVEGLSKMGARIEERPDGMVIHGGRSLQGAECESHGDHRVAMALAVAGLIAEGETVIADAEAVDISYPDFWHHLEGLVG